MVRNDSYKYINNYYHWSVLNIYVNGIIIAENSDTFFDSANNIKDEKMIRTLLSARKEKPVICIINSCNIVQNL